MLRRWWPIWSSFPVSRAAFTIARAPSMVFDISFSQYTFLPALRQSTVCCECQKSGVAITTASRSFSLSSISR